MLGIDFGTTTTYLSEGAASEPPELVRLGGFTPFMPSIVSRDGDGLAVGREAVAQTPLHQVRSIKRAITLRQDTIASPHGDEINVDEGITALLVELAALAGRQGLDVSQSDAVRIGCPAMWDAEQRDRLRRCAVKAGLNVGLGTIIDEPVAAGLGWVTNMLYEGHRFDDRHVLVFDMGGGTLDVSVILVKADFGETTQVHVLSSCGSNEAGDTLDEAVADELLRRARGRRHDTRADDDMLRAWTIQAAREAKEDLSANSRTQVRIADSRFNLAEVVFTIDDLHDAFTHQWQRARGVVERALKEAAFASEGISVDALRSRSLESIALGITDVVLVGGMTESPVVRERIAELFPSSEIHLPDPGSAVANGLAEVTGYESINLNRPGFSFTLEWADEIVTLYRAYEPLYGIGAGFHTVRPRYQWTSLNNDAANATQLQRIRGGHGEAALRARTFDGRLIPFEDAEGNAINIRVPFRGQPVRLNLHPNGRIHVEDGTGHATTTRLDSWPALSGSAVPRLKLHWTENRDYTDHLEQQQQGRGWWDNR